MNLMMNKQSAQIKWFNTPVHTSDDVYLFYEYSDMNPKFIHVSSKNRMF